MMMIRKKKESSATCVLPKTVSDRTEEEEEEENEMRSELDLSDRWTCMKKVVCLGAPFTFNRECLHQFKGNVYAFGWN